MIRYHSLSRRSIQRGHSGRSPQSALSGVARVLVHAGRLNAKAAEELVKSSREEDQLHLVGHRGRAVAPSDLAHTLSTALALPLLDLSAIDAQKLPKNVVDAKLSLQYQVIVLGKRGNRLFIGGADPTDQEAVERIKFATQLSPEWVIVEHDKLGKVLEATGATATEALESLSSLATSSSTSPTTSPRRRRPRRPPTWKTHRSCASCRRC